MVERIFEFAEQPWTDATVESIEARLDKNPRGKHGTIAYHLEDVGLDPDERREALAFYRAHFDLAEDH